MEYNYPVSVVITYFNSAATIIDTLDSIACQSFNDYEVVAVDDGSTDDTASLIKKWGKNNKQINLKLYNPGKLGRGKALNYGVNSAQGEWIAICDADDLWHPDKLRIQMEIINTNSNIDVLGTKTKHFNRNVRIQPVPLPDPPYKIKKYSKKDFLVSNRIAHSSALIRKNLCNYAETRTSQFDYELWLKLISSEHHLFSVDSYLTYHRLSKNQFFEGKQGKIYRINSYRLKMRYCTKPRHFLYILYNTFKLFFDLSFPRTIRLFVRNIIMH